MFNLGRKNIEKLNDFNWVDLKFCSYRMYEKAKQKENKVILNNK